MKKVGERCSTDGDTGICGALNSFCTMTTKRCECENDDVPVWGGERCANVQTTTAGETCSSRYCATSAHCSRSNPEWLVVDPEWSKVDGNCCFFLLL